MESTINEVRQELVRAIAKFPTWPTDPLHALAVLGEEFGELTKDVLQLTYEPHKTSAENVRKEAIQCAAMALRFAASLDRYEYAPGVQHNQSRDWWHRVYVDRLVRKGMTAAEAEATYQAGGDDHDYSSDPVQAADDELAYQSEG